MENEMIERVIEAMGADPRVFVEHRKEEVLPYVVIDETFDPPAVCARAAAPSDAYEVRDKRILLHKAQGILAVMRKPTEAMVRRACVEVFSDDGWKLSERLFEGGWRAMIDAALTPPTNS